MCNGPVIVIVVGERERESTLPKEGNFRKLAAIEVLYIKDGLLSCVSVRAVVSVIFT